MSREVQFYKDRLKQITRNKDRAKLREWHTEAKKYIKKLKEWESIESKKTDFHAPARAKIYRDRRAGIEKLIKDEYHKSLAILKNLNPKGATMAKAKKKTRKSGRVSVKAHTRRYPR